MSNDNGLQRCDCNWKNGNSDPCQIFVVKESWFCPNIVWSTASFFIKISVAILFASFFILNIKPGKKKQFFIYDKYIFCEKYFFLQKLQLLAKITVFFFAKNTFFYAKNEIFAKNAIFSKNVIFLKNAIFCEECNFFKK